LPVDFSLSRFPSRIAADEMMLGGGNRQRDRHRSALADPALDVQSSMMKLHDVLDYRRSTTTVKVARG